MTTKEKKEYIPLGSGWDERLHIPYMFSMDEHVLIEVSKLPLEWIKLLYNKYCHLESFQRKVGVVKDVQNMSEEELERVKGGLRGWFLSRSPNVVKALVECGIDNEEVWDCIQIHPSERTHVRRINHEYINCLTTVMHFRIAVTSTNDMFSLYSMHMHSLAYLVQHHMSLTIPEDGYMQRYRDAQMLIPCTEML